MTDKRFGEINEVLRKDFLKIPDGEDCGNHPYFLVNNPQMGPKGRFDDETGDFKALGRQPDPAPEIMRIAGISPEEVAEFVHLARHDYHERVRRMKKKIFQRLRGR